MKIDDISSSQIMPVKEEKKDVTLKEFENFILETFSKIDTKYFSLYNNYSVKNCSNVLTDILKNIELEIKQKNISSTENIHSISIIFETINNQLKLLKNLNLNDLNNFDILVILLATSVSFLKKSN